MENNTGGMTVEEMAQGLLGLAWMELRTYPDAVKALRKAANDMVALPKVTVELDQVKRERDEAVATAAGIQEKTFEFLDRLINCHIDYCDHGSGNPGICLRLVRESEWEDLRTALSTPPSAHLERIQREAKQAESRRFIDILRALDPEHLCDVFDDIGIEKYLGDWLDGVKKKAAADVLEGIRLAYCRDAELRGAK